jgi:hypothetical protein
MTRTFLVALSVLGLAIAAQPVAVHARQAAPAKATTAAGTVKTVTTQSLIIVSGGKDMTFTIDGTTKFVGKGLSTQSVGQDHGDRRGRRRRQGAGPYHDTGGGAMHAASVRITEKRAAAQK